MFRSAVAFCLFLSFVSCKKTETNTSDGYQIHQGETMGTTFSIKYKSTIDLSTSFDSLLVALNDEVSTYIPSSAISVFNQQKEGSFFMGEFPHFKHNYRLASQIKSKTNGAFNPQVMPLVNYWGFGYSEVNSILVDSVVVDSLLELVNAEVTQGKDFLSKANENTQLDFSAVAKGYGVDMICEFLSEKQSVDYMVEIGGETRCSGVNGRGEIWAIGLNTPDENASITDILAVVSLEDMAIATSGNYRNYKESNGQRFVHTINPTTGYPEKSNLLSASVFAKDCATADAYATACMVLGVDAALQLQDLEEVLGLVLIYLEEGQFKVLVTDKIKSKIQL